MNGLDWDWAFAWSVMPDLLHGLRITVIATIAASSVSFVLGLVWTLLRLRRIAVISPAVDLFVLFIRGTPLLVQLYVVFYVLPKWGVSLSALATGIVGLGVFYSASASEIYRAGIEDIPIGQWEAALTLGLPLRRLWLGIILPQAIRAVLPMLGNLVVAMFKETALLSTITVMELMAEAKNAGSIDFRFVEPLTLAGALYLVISFAAASALRRLEVRHG